MTRRVPTAEDAARYAAEFVKDRSIMNAYRRAFPERKHKNDATVARVSSRYHNRPEVVEAVAKLAQKQAYAAEFDANKVLSELASLAFSDIGDLLSDDGTKLRELKDIPKPIRKIIASAEIITNDEGVVLRVHKIKMWDKLAALDKLGRHLKLFHDHKLEVSDADGGPLLRTEMSDLELARRMAFVINEALRRQGQAAAGS